MTVTIGDKDGTYKGEATVRLIGPNQFEFVGPLNFTVDPGDVLLLRVSSEELEHRMDRERACGISL